MLQPGLLTTLQDLGRKGGHFYAVPASGVMDPDAATIANLLLRQPAGAPLIECTSLAPEIRFHGAGRIALTGADFHWTRNGAPLQLNTVIAIADGDVLAGKHAQDQLRGYIAVQGSWQGRRVYGSASTFLNGGFGGHEGRMLRKGDRLEWHWTPRQAEGIPLLQLRPGPEYDWLTADAKALLRSAAYTVGVESNRMGARLQGPRLDSRAYQLADSVPVLPGFIQLPPSGQPIVVLQDGQVSGGYPRISYLRTEELARFNQVPLGRQVRFRLD